MLRVGSWVLCVYWGTCKCLWGPGWCCVPSPCLWLLSERGAGSQGARQVLGETLILPVPLLCLAARALLLVLGVCCCGILLLCLCGDSYYCESLLHCY